MSMKKLPLALAVAAAIAAPAAMAQSSVTVYGKLYPYLLNEDGSGATTGASSATLGAAGTGVDGVTRNTGMVSGNSRMGIRGQEDLGGGLKAMFQMESVVSVNDGAAGSGTTFWNRDTFIGLERKGMGTIKLGLMDTVFKNYGDTLGILGISSGTFMSTSNVLRKPGFGTSNDARFHERAANSIQIESAEFNDFQFGAQFTFDPAKTATREKTLQSFGVAYDTDTWYVALAHEIHNDYFGGSAQTQTSSMRNTADLTVNSKDKATQFTVEYRLGKSHKFEFDWIAKEYKENATAANRFVSYKNTAFQFAMENRWSDKWRTAANYVKSAAGSCTRVAPAACSTAGLAGSKFTVAGAYYFSRRTLAFASFSSVSNGAAARFSSSELGGARANPGEDIRQFAAGLSHTF